MSIGYNVGLVTERPIIKPNYDIFGLITREGSEIIFVSSEKDPEKYFCTYRNEAVSHGDTFVIRRRDVDNKKVNDTIRLPPRFRPDLQIISKIYVPAVYL